MLASCSKSSSGGGTTKPPPPSNPGGYDSANQIQPSALVAFWGFNGNFNETKHNLTATASGTVTYTTGVKGQAYQGNGWRCYPGGSLWIFGQCICGYPLSRALPFPCGIMIRSMPQMASTRPDKSRAVLHMWMLRNGRIC